MPRRARTAVASSLVALAALLWNAPALAMLPCPAGTKDQGLLALVLLVVFTVTAIVALVVGVRRGVAADGMARIGWIALGLVAALGFFVAGAGLFVAFLMSCRPA